MQIQPAAIGFDFDGVIADIGEAFLRIACTRYGYCSFTLEEMKTFQVDDCTPVPREVIENIFQDIVVDTLATGVIPLPGAISTLETLSNISKPLIITARPLREPVSLWLKHYLSEEAFSQVRIIATEDHDNKVPFIQQEGLTHFIDDRGETCVQIAKAGLTPILFRQPWNRDYLSFTTVHGWQDISQLINIS